MCAFRPLLASLLLALLSSPAAAASAAGQRPDDTVKLAVVLVVDQFGHEALVRATPQLAGGLGRLMREGAWFRDAHFSHQNTYTGPGHATLATGAYAYKNGIVSNKYYDRSVRRTFTMLRDPAHPMLEGPTDADQDDTSPANLLGETLGDRLRLASAMRSRVVAVALKDRAAILLGGQLGSAWWLNEANGRMTTSSWYAKELPAWVRRFNERSPLERARGRVWEWSLRPELYLGPDDAPWEGDSHGLGRVFPHRLPTEAPAAALAAAFIRTPLALEATVDFALDAVEAERLGRRGVVDLLAVSFSATDSIGHQFGPDSHEYQDAVVRADRAIGRLLQQLEKSVGGRQHLLVGFASDHGVAAPPEQLAAAGLAAVRIGKQQIRDAIEADLDARYGADDWIAALEDPSVFLDHEVARRRKVDLEELREAAGRAALKVPGIARFFTYRQMMDGRLPRTPLGRAVELSFHPDRTGDVVLLSSPHSIWGRYAERPYGAAHGTPYSYDTHVPLIFWGAGIKKGEHRHRVDAADFTPTLASALGLSAPACADGEPRAEALR